MSTTAQVAPPPGSNHSVDSSHLSVIDQADYQPIRQPLRGGILAGTIMIDGNPRTVTVYLLDRNNNIVEAREDRLDAELKRRVCSLASASIDHFGNEIQIAHTSPHSLSRDTNGSPRLWTYSGGPDLEGEYHLEDVENEDFECVDGESEWNDIEALILGVYNRNMQTPDRMLFAIGSPREQHQQGDEGSVHVKLHHETTSPRTGLNDESNLTRLLGIDDEEEEEDEHRAAPKGFNDSVPSHMLDMSEKPLRDTDYQGPSPASYLVPTVEAHRTGARRRPSSYNPPAAAAADNNYSNMTTTLQSRVQEDRYRFSPIETGSKHQKRKKGSLDASFLENSPQTALYQQILTMHLDSREAREAITTYLTNRDGKSPNRQTIDAEILRFKQAQTQRR